MSNGIKMTPVTVREWGSEDDDTWAAFGELVIDIDESEAYEQEASRLYINDKGRYTILSSSGCSCWDGDWDGWTDLSKTATRKIAQSWTKDRWGSSVRLGEWIKENL